MAVGKKSRNFGVIKKESKFYPCVIRTTCWLFSVYLRSDMSLGALSWHMLGLCSEILVELSYGIHLEGSDSKRLSTIAGINPGPYQSWVVCLNYKTRKNAGVAEAWSCSYRTRWVFCTQTNGVSFSFRRHKKLTQSQR